MREPTRAFPVITPLSSSLARTAHPGHIHVLGSQTGLSARMTAEVTATVNRAHVIPRAGAAFNQRRTRPAARRGSHDRSYQPHQPAIAAAVAAQAGLTAVIIGRDDDHGA